MGNSLTARVHSTFNDNNSEKTKLLRLLDSFLRRGGS